MAIKFQYNKTSLGELGKQLKMRQKALPTIKSKESALRSEVKKAKDSASDYRRRLDALKAEYDYMVSLWGEFDCDLLRIADVEFVGPENRGCAHARPAGSEIRGETLRSVLLAGVVRRRSRHPQAHGAAGDRVRGLQPEDGTAGPCAPQNHSKGELVRKGSDTRVRGRHT